MLAGTLAFACSGNDTSYVDPSAVDINPPGFGGSAGHLDSNAGAAGENEAGASSGGASGDTGAAGAAEAGASGANEGGAAGVAEGGAAGLAEGGAAGVAEAGASGANEAGAAGAGEEPDGGTGEEPDSGTVNPPECTIEFVTPSAADVPLTFGPSDDQDGTPCGSGFTTSVVVASSGVSVQLFVDGTPWASENVTAATALFEGVVIGSRTPATSTLRAVASMGDNRTCEVTLDPIGVDCTGPSCVLAGPNLLGALAGSDDTDALTAGLQTSFSVQTDAENSGEDVHLILNGDENALLTQSADNNGAATFSPVTLSEGPSRTVQAECRDTLGNVTRSSVSTWSVALDACDVEFVTPDSTSDPITLGPNDDQDGDPCGTEFRTSVDVNTNASSLTLLVDDQPVGTVPASGGAAHFSNVLLGTRLPAASTLKVHATMADGRTCEVTRPSLMVDCEGPSCTLVGPQTASLNTADDLDTNATDLQVNFSVTTNAENIGQTVRLIIDGNDAGALTALVADDHGTASAPFDSTTLAEGAGRTVQAECVDALGNITRSATATFGIDITACGISIGSVAGGADPITHAIDEAALTADIQVTALGHVTGAGCTSVRVGVCTQPLGSFSGNGLDLQTGDWSELVTLQDVSGSGEVCAEVQDDGGNVTRVRTPVTVRSNDPVVAFSTPAGDVNINVAGTAGALADATLGGPSCETTIVVDCTDVGSSVSLSADGDPLGTSQTCVSATGLTPPFAGQATFSVSLATQDGGEKYSLTASQTVAGLTGTSSPILVGADCNPPVPTFANPLCNSQLNLDTDDALVAPGLQHDVTVNNDGVAHVDLTVGAASPLGGDGDQTSTTFSNVDFGDPGNVTLSATVTDAQGNVGTVSCQVQVVEAPAVDILVPIAPVSPTTATLLSTADDCTPVGGGYGITVSGTTSAIAGSSVEVDVGAGAPFAFADVADGGGGPNTFSGCLPISDGANQLITVSIDDSVNPVGTDSTAVTIDTQGPSDPVSITLTSMTNRRGGLVDFTWNHIEDSGGGVLAGYEMRCAPSTIASESDWTNARVLTVHTPAALATAPAATENFSGFRVGTTEQCLMRGHDATNALSPLGPNTSVSLSFLQTDYTSVLDGTNSFTSVAALGDINGDGSDDLIYGTTNKGAQIFLGASAGHPFDTAADIIINGLTTGAFGATVASVGDVNGDTIPDFAVTARAATGNNGTVYLFFGKASDAAWGSLPVTINVTTGGCNADVCLVGSAAGAFFGWDVTGTDFNGDTKTDLVVSARQNNSGKGAVYVLLGGTQFSSLPAHSVVNVPSGNPNGFVITAPVSPSRSNFGVAVAAVGAGGDGKGDLAIGASGLVGAAATDPGALFFLAGESYPNATTGLVAPSATAPVEVLSTTSGDYGFPVRAIGDFDGDGLGDLATGRNYSSLGIAEAYYRNEGVIPLDYPTGQGFVLQFAGTNPDIDFGTFVATGFHPSLGTIGDLDKDGATELLVGSLSGTSTGGSVALFYGPRLVDARIPRVRTSHNHDAADFLLSGSTNTSVMVPNFVGDIDHDGFNDIVVVDGGAGTDKLVLLH